MEVVYAITPETATTTHDFWAVARDFALGDEEVSDFLRDSNRTVVLQDVVALGKLARITSCFPAAFAPVHVRQDRGGRVVALGKLAKSIRTDGDGYQELSINIDTGGLAARRLIKAQIEAGAEAARPVSAP